jgi:hypothetical protein
MCIGGVGGGWLGERCALAAVLMRCVFLIPAPASAACLLLLPQIEDEEMDE